MAVSQQTRIIFGLKVRQFRQERGWNFEELSQQTGISVSYLNEIEKGKKFPQPENQGKLAKAFGITPEFLTSPVLTKQYAPLGNLLQSNFLNELPLDLFGIEMQQVVEIIARAPDKVNAFISALLEIARNYSLREENFFFAALRAYQELHVNYFEDIEAAADGFVLRHQLPNTGGGIGAETLQKLLENQFAYTVDTRGLGRYPELRGVRAVFNAKKRKLLLHPDLSEQQRVFQLAKELGFNVLQLKERPLASSVMRAGSFEEVLNNYKAAYFAVALLIDRQCFTQDLAAVFSLEQWNPAVFVDLMQKYQVSPEVLFQRFNVLSHGFDVHKVFFFRVIHRLDTGAFDIDKELHLNRRHQPHASGLNEHYCRRWVALSLLEDLHQQQKSGQANGPLVGIQRARFADSGEEYLCFAVAKAGHPTPQRNVSVTFGILLDEHTRRTVRFANSPDIPTRVVNVACERCALSDCTERAAPPTVVQRREARKQTLEVLRRVSGEK